MAEVIFGLGALVTSVFGPGVFAGAFASLAVFSLSPIGSALITGLVGLGLNYVTSMLQRAPKPEDVQSTVKNPVSPRWRHYGRCKFGGALVFIESKAGALYRVIALGTGELDAIEEVWADDTFLTLDGDGYATNPKYYPDLRVHTRLGLPTETHYSILEDEFPEWDEDHRGDGVSSMLAIQYPMGSEFLSSTFPNLTNTVMRVVARGSKVYNLNPDSPPDSPAVLSWSDNAASIIRDYMTHADGMRIPVAMFNTPLAAAGWAAAYTRCDEDVPLKAGGTEKRYRLWGSYRLDERPADVLGRMLMACDGRIVPTADGGVTLDVGAWAEPTVTLDEESILGFADLSRGRNILTTANVIRATYLSPQHDYQSTDADQWIDENDVLVRGEIVRDTSFIMAPSHSQCRRLMKLEAYRANPNWIGTFQCNLKALAAFGQRLVRITYPQFEIDEVFEIVDFKFNIVEGDKLESVTLQVQSMPEEAYDWDAATEEGTAPINEETTVDNTIPVPTGLGFTIVRLAVSGQLAPFGAITFAAPPSEALIPQARYKRVADSTWNFLNIEEGETTAQFGPLSDGDEYEVQLRFVTLTGRQGDWTASQTETAVGDTEAPAELSAFTLTGSAPYLGNAPFSITTASDAHLASLGIYRVPSGGALDIGASPTQLVATITGPPKPSTFAYVHGDTTRTLRSDVENPNFDDGSTWTLGADLTITGGKLVKVAGAAERGASQSITTMTAGDVLRVGFTGSDVTAGNIWPRLTGGATVNGANVLSANGICFNRMVATNAHNSLAFRFSAASDGKIDTVIVYDETPACADAGEWDYYAVPFNISGVAGTASGPVPVTIY
jgi:hypothetical protein